MINIHCSGFALTTQLFPSGFGRGQTVAVALQLGKTVKEYRRGKAG